MKIRCVTELTVTLMISWQWHYEKLMLFFRKNLISCFGDFGVSSTMACVSRYLFIYGWCLFRDVYRLIVIKI